jgi:hypothetical protein
MNIAYGRLVLVALGAFMAGFGPEFDASWKTQHIPDTASFGMVMKAFTVSCIEGLQGGVPACISACIAFFMRQDADTPTFQLASAKQSAIQQLEDEMKISTVGAVLSRNKATRDTEDVN